MSQQKSNQMRKYILLVLIAISACTAKVEVDETPTRAEVDEVMDAWHKAAADANFEKYFDYFESDSSIFMGTDATERWTVAVFKPWSKPFFDRGKAWNFTAVKRYVFFSEDGKTAWFDEELDTPNLGPSRGTGVLNKTENGWKIAHYNLTVPIPNELTDEFIPKIDSVLNSK